MFPTTPWSVLLHDTACSEFGMSLAQVDMLETSSFVQVKITLMCVCLGTEQDLEVICKHGITKTDINKFKVQLSLSPLASSFRHCCAIEAARQQAFEAA